MNQDTLWKTKLAARIHDPAEKALVLLRDPAGHEGGTAKALRRLLGLDGLNGGSIVQQDSGALASVLLKEGLPAELYRHVQRADWWAAAADRPQFPMDEVVTPAGKAFAVAAWAQVRWAKEPVLVHPLTGETVELGSLQETELEALKQRSFDHFASLAASVESADGAGPDYHKLLLAFWRFGPCLSVTGVDTEDNHKLGALWEVLPADTRIPDHSIWDHLDITSAFAGAFASDPSGEAALLSLSIGPVQGFIASARSTSDLWAGSHLLSRLSWEAMRSVCEQLGPDAILFPRLRGIPQVDLWLRDQAGLPDSLFDNCEWMKGATDSNPLFSAALPNRFVAVVPASRAREIAQTVEGVVRDWLGRLGSDVVMRLLDEAGFDKEATSTPYEQMKEQLAGFPELHWASVPFSLVRCADPVRQRDLDLSGLEQTMAPFFGVKAGEPCGFLATPAWQALRRDIQWKDGTTFMAPNPGVLYPAIHDLAERVLAAAKGTRQFGQLAQQGWRCSLTGETEWLTTDRSQLGRSYRQQEDTLWAKVAKSRPAWARKGEHLGALPAIKRLWPTIFAEQVGCAISRREDGTGKPPARFVVSTHTMALAHQLDAWLKGNPEVDPAVRDACDAAGAEPVALPRALMRRHGRNRAMDDARRIPALLDLASDAGGEAESQADTRMIRRLLARGSGRETVRIETYYALMMLDGDRMGALLAGEDGTAIAYRDSFHPKVRRGFDERAVANPLVKAYGQQQRAVSPGRHLAISAALNDFSQSVARHVVEEEYLGRIIYAGGDDVLAMLPVADLLPAMQRLRSAYSGTAPEDDAMDWGRLRSDPNELHCRNGFAFLGGRLMRMMGGRATASAGAVIAHHKAPMGAVLRELRVAERRAKTLGGRDACSITVIKRSGGALQLTCKWGEPVRLLADLRDFLALGDTSRRAVYNTLEWLLDLPDPQACQGMLESLLAVQLARQSGDRSGALAGSLAARLAAATVVQPGHRLEWLTNFLTVAEFLARETRLPVSQAGLDQEERAA